MARRSKFGLSFSWKRASGLSAAKAKISRTIGIPLTKSGRQQKLGRMMGSLALAGFSTKSNKPATSSDSSAVATPTIMPLPNPSIVNTPPVALPNKSVSAGQLHGQLANAIAWRDNAAFRFAEVKSQLSAINSRIASAKRAAMLRAGHRRILLAVPESWHISATIIAVWTAVCLAAAVAFSFSLQFATLLIVAVIAGMATAGVSWLVLFRTALSTLEQRIAEARHAEQAATEQRDHLGHPRNAVADELSMARAEVRRIESILESRIFRLMNEPFREYRGERFEQFLADVFQERGFTVSFTKTTGDQGVDLLLERNSVRWAVQAKGYVSSVGNDSVQQAHAGCGYYRCHRSAAVTNSVFTASARELAERLSPACLLICGDDIPAIICGELELH